MDGKLWEVIGGEGKGGILVREGKDLGSCAASERLSTGALVSELDLDGERLQYKRVSGSGPDTGWVSVKLKDKELLVITDKVPPASVGKQVTLAQPPPLGRKIRVLGLHGGGANTNIMRVQTMKLKSTLGDVAEWDFLPGGTTWKTIPPDDMMKAIAKDEPFLGWYHVSNNDNSDRPYNDKLFDLSVEFVYSAVEEGVDRVLKYIETSGPVDVIVGFSQGCIVTHLIQGTLRAKSLQIPWRINVLFNGMRVRDSRYHDLFKEKLPTPTVMVFGKQDEFYDYGRQSQVSMYEDPVILEHDEGHKFPGKQPRAKEIFERVVKEIRWHCGLPA